MKNFSVNLVTHTPNGEKIIAYCARVSNPKNQNNDEIKGLLSYCLRENHWSIFEQASLTVEIETSRAISAQMLRHRSFTFQEFSQRYSEVLDCYFYKARRKDLKNRQNSIDDMNEEDQKWFENAQKLIWNVSKKFYEEALKRDIAKESARFLLPLSSKTRLYMTGNVRSWIHYLQVRLHPSTQFEHREIAKAIWEIFKTVYPTISEILINLNKIERD